MAGIQDQNPHPFVQDFVEGQAVLGPQEGIAQELVVNEREGLDRNDRQLFDTGEAMVKEKLVLLEAQLSPAESLRVREAINFMDGVRNFDDAVFKKGIAELKSGKAQKEIIEDFLKTYRLGVGDPSTLLYRELAKNIYLNGLILDCRTRSFTQNNFERINEAFNWHFSRATQIGTQLTGGETHNGGKKPVWVLFKEDDISEKFIVKPRSGLIDRRVLDLFERINALPREQRFEGAPRLPHYRIVNPSTEQGWQLEEGLAHVSLSMSIGKSLPLLR